MHFVRDIIQKGTLHVHHVNTQDQLADLLTKPLSRQQTELLRAKIGVTNGDSILRGRIKDDSLNHAADPINHKSANNQACNN